MSMTQVLDCSSKLSPTKGDQLVKACGAFQEFADNTEISKNRTLGFIFLMYSTFQDSFYCCPLFSNDSTFWHSVEFWSL